jgi:hypothetical protein
MQGNVKLLMEDVAALRPTLFIAVPRIIERVEDGGGLLGLLNHDFTVRCCVCRAGCIAELRALTCLPPQPALHRPACDSCCKHSPSLWASFIMPLPCSACQA